MPSHCARSDHLPPELAEMRLRIEILPGNWRGPFLALWKRLADKLRRQKKMVQTAQEVIDQLQLDLKYMRFDLEATRRERDALRTFDSRD